MAEIFRFPYDACRRVHSRKPRRSKNGTPEERAAKASAEIASSPPAEVVPLSAVMVETPADKVDGRKLRGSPLRDKVPTISFAVTIVGKMHTAGLKGQPLPSDAAGWLAELHKGAATARFVADELDRAAERLRQHQTELPPALSVKEFRETYDRLSPVHQRMIDDKIDALIRERTKSEVSDFPVKLPVHGLGQSVLNSPEENR